MTALFLKNYVRQIILIFIKQLQIFDIVTFQILKTKKQYMHIHMGETIKKLKYEKLCKNRRHLVS